MRRLCAIVTLVCAFGGPAFAQECLHGQNETADQRARRLNALRATRTVNNLEANQPGARSAVFFQQTDLASSPFAAKAQGGDGFFEKLNFTPGQELMPGWKLRLDVTQKGYWFTIIDTTDACGFRYISNQDGLIFTAEPIR